MILQNLRWRRENKMDTIHQEGKWIKIPSHFIANRMLENSSSVWLWLISRLERHDEGLPVFHFWSWQRGTSRRNRIHSCVEHQKSSPSRYLIAQTRKYLLVPNIENTDMLIFEFWLPKGKIPRLQRYMDKMMDEASLQVVELRKKGMTDVTRWTLLTNVENFNIMQHACAACKPLFKLYSQNNYCCLLL